MAKITKLKDFHPTVDMEAFLKDLPDDFTEVLVIGRLKNSDYFFRSRSGERRALTNEEFNWLLDFAKFNIMAEANKFQ